MPNFIVYNRKLKRFLIIHCIPLSAGLCFGFGKVSQRLCYRCSLTTASWLLEEIHVGRFDRTNRYTQISNSRVKSEYDLCTNFAYGYFYDLDPRFLLWECTLLKRAYIEKWWSFVVEIWVVFNCLSKIIHLYCTYPIEINVIVWLSVGKQIIKGTGTDIGVMYRCSETVSRMNVLKPPELRWYAVVYSLEERSMVH